MKLNKRNKDGSINLLEVTGENLGEIVSPLHPEFESQIEDGIFDIVMLLVKNSYFVIDSCEGHWRKNDHSHFTIAFAEEREMKRFMERLKGIPGISLSVNDTWLQVDNEVDFINKMFLRNYNKYKFLHVSILKERNLAIKIMFTGIVRKIILRKLK
jgi:hypothetical protein